MGTVISNSSGQLQVNIHPPIRGTLFAS